MKQNNTRNPNGVRVLGTYSATNPVTPIAYAIFGVGLLIAPVEFMSISGFALAALLALVGIYYILVYIRSDKSGAFTRQDLTLGLTALAGGALLFAMPEAPHGVLPLVWGGALVVGGFAKVQTAVDMYRFDVADWWHCLVGAVLALALGVVALYDPFRADEILLRFIGGSLTAEALMDAYCGLMLYRLHRGKLRSLSDAREQRAADRAANKAKRRADAEAKADKANDAMVTTGAAGSPKASEANKAGAASPQTAKSQQAAAPGATPEPGSASGHAGDNPDGGSQT